MPTKGRKRKFDNDKWIRDHFEKIIHQYGRKFPYVLVAGGRVFPVGPRDDIRELEAKLEGRFGRVTGLPIPKPKDFHAILSFVRITFRV